MSGGDFEADLRYLLYFWLAAWVSSVLSNFTRLSPLVYYLLFGCILGNLHWVRHTSFLTSFSEFSIAVVFFAFGLDENVAHFMEGIRSAWGIAFIGAAVPFGVGFGCSLLFWPDLKVEAALMGGLAVTATAVSLTMIALKAEGLATSKPAIGIMTSAVLDDIASLALVAIMVPIASGEADPTVEGISWILGKAVLFFIAVIFGHLVVLPDGVEQGLVSHIPLVRTYGIRHILILNDGEQATLVSLTFGLLFCMIAIWLGFHPAIGAYMSGLIMEESYYDLDGGNSFQHTLHFIENAAFEWLGPVFFINLGASIIIDAEMLGSVIWYSLILFVALFVGQFSSATFSARYVPGGFTWAESAMIGFGMLGRAELFFVVLNLCYVDKNIMPKEMFYTFTFAAMFLNISVPVCITLFKPIYLKHRPARTTLRCSVGSASDVPHQGVSRVSRISKCISSISSMFSVSRPVEDILVRKAKKKELAAERRAFKVVPKLSTSNIASASSEPAEADTCDRSQGFKSADDSNLRLVAEDTDIIVENIEDDDTITETQAGA